MQHINTRLDMNIDHSKLILCHSPLKQYLNHIKDEFVVEVGEFKEGDQGVVSGVGLLRVSDIYSTDKSEYGHGH